MLNRLERAREVPIGAAKAVRAAESARRGVESLILCAWRDEWASINLTRFELCVLDVKLFPQLIFEAVLPPRPALGFA